MTISKTPNSLILTLFIVLVYFQKSILAQCPEGYKMSNILKGQCIAKNGCDGWYLLDEREELTNREISSCLQSDPQINPRKYGQQKISCILGDALGAIYVCANRYITPDLLISGICNDDEYLFAAKYPFECIKKTDFNQSQFGIISENNKSILPQCNVGQIVVDDNIFGQNQTAIAVKRCLSCPKEKVINFDKTNCVKSCEVDEVIDFRNPYYSRCIKQKNCDLFSADSMSCIKECDNRQIIQTTQSNTKICQKCPPNKPYRSFDKTECFFECPGAGSSNDNADFGNCRKEIIRDRKKRKGNYSQMRCYGECVDKVCQKFEGDSFIQCEQEINKASLLLNNYCKRVTFERCDSLPKEFNLKPTIIDLHACWYNYTNDTNDTIDNNGINWNNGNNEINDNYEVIEIKNKN